MGSLRTIRKPIPLKITALAENIQYSKSEYSISLIWNSYENLRFSIVWRPTNVMRTSTLYLTVNWQHVQSHGILFKPIYQAVGCGELLSQPKADDLLSDWGCWLDTYKEPWAEIIGFPERWKDMFASVLTRKEFLEVLERGRFGAERFPHARIF
jgi:hypothetical protein